MNSIEEIFAESRKLETQQIQLLKKVVKYGEEFLKKYGITSIYCCDSGKIKIIQKDLGIKEEISNHIEGFLYYHHVSKVDKKLDRDVYKYPHGSSKIEYITGFAYAIALKLFRLMAEETYLIRMEFPLSVSTQFTMTEKAFVYTLTIPYSYYKKTFEYILKEQIKEDHNTNEIIQKTFNRICIHSKMMMNFIHQFYWYIFFDELSTIFNSCFNIEDVLLEEYSKRHEEYEEYIKQIKKDEEKIEEEARKRVAYELEDERKADKECLQRIDKERKKKTEREINIWDLIFSGIVNY